MLSLKPLVATIAFAMSASCGAELLRPDPGFVEVRIESHPTGWGFAHKIVRPDGTVAGAHLSGGPEAPQVYESKSQLSVGDLAELRALLKEIEAHPPKALPTPDRRDSGYTSVVIVTGADPGLEFRAAWGTGFDAPAVQTLWNLIHKYDAGAW